MKEQLRHHNLYRVRRQSDEEYGPLEDMLKNGVCPKCGSEEVYKARSEPEKVLSFLFGSLVWQDKHPTVDNYACGNCGYVEFYLIAGHLERVKKEWHKARKREL